MCTEYYVVFPPYRLKCKNYTFWKYWYSVFHYCKNITTYKIRFWFAFLLTYIINCCCKHNPFPHRTIHRKSGFNYSFLLFIWFKLCQQIFRIDILELSELNTRHLYYLYNTYTTYAVLEVTFFRSPTNFQCHFILCPIQNKSILRDISWFRNKSGSTGLELEIFASGRW